MSSKATKKTSTGADDVQLDYEAIKILGQRGSGPSLRYLVRWAAPWDKPEHDTWEPKKHLRLNKDDPKSDYVDIYKEYLSGFDEWTEEQAESNSSGSETSDGDGKTALKIMKHRGRAEDLEFLVRWAAPWNKPKFDTWRPLEYFELPSNRSASTSKKYVDVYHEYMWKLNQQKTKLARSSNDIILKPNPRPAPPPPPPPPATRKPKRRPAQATVLASSGPKRPPPPAPGAAACKIITIDDTTERSEEEIARDQRLMEELRRLSNRQRPRQVRERVMCMA